MSDSVLCGGILLAAGIVERFNTFKNWKRQSEYARNYKEKAYIH